MVRRSVLTLSFALAAVAHAPTTGFADPPAGKKYALLVGVQRYSDATKLRNLDYTEKDVSDLGAVLEKQGYRVTLLTRAEFIKQDKDFLRPTAKNIKLYLDALAADCHPEDTLLVAFSGHGAHLKATDKLYFCPSETDLADEKTLVKIDDVMTALNAVNCKAGSKVFLMDACRNDPADGAGTGPPVEVKSSTMPLVPDPPGGTVAMFSCSKGQISHESQTHRRSFLFHHVIEGLSGKAASKKTGEVTWLGLANYVSEELPDSVRKDKGPLVRQTPEIRGEQRAMVLARYRDGEVGTIPSTDKYIVSKTFPAMKLRRIPAGKFLMGSPANEKNHGIDEKLHEVTLTNDFLLAEYTVTVGQWRAFQTDTGHDAKAGAAPPFQQGDDHPVVNVNHDDALAFCNWLGKKGRANVPTADRGGMGVRLSGGDENALLLRRPTERYAGQLRRHQSLRDHREGAIPAANRESQFLSAECLRTP